MVLECLNAAFLSGGAQGNSAILPGTNGHGFVARAVMGGAGAGCEPMPVRDVLHGSVPHPALDGLTLPRSR